MFWDKISGLYDFFETVYNGKVYRGLGERVAAEIGQDALCPGSCYEAIMLKAMIFID